MSRDEEKGADKEEELVGYAALAHFIAKNREHSGSIYHRYENVAARNLLYLQSELQDLRLELEAFDREDVEEPDIDDAALASDWRALRERVVRDRRNKLADSKACKRQKLIMRMRYKIKEYGKLRHTQRICNRITRCKHVDC